MLIISCIYNKNNSILCLKLSKQPANGRSILPYSELAHSGETLEFSFKVPTPETHLYICTYSANWTQMQGRLMSTE